jgi:hypothetical protein
VTDGPAPEPAEDSSGEAVAPEVERLASDMEGSLAGSGIEIRAVPQAERQTRFFRRMTGLYVLAAVAFTGLFIAALVHGGSWVDLVAAGLSTVFLWLVVIGRARGIEIRRD